MTEAGGVSAARDSLCEFREIAVRRLGSGKVHRADVAPHDLLEVTHWGAACTVVALDSVATLCGCVLRGGDIIEIPAGDALESWRRNHGVCKPCERIAAMR